ncbi:MAG: prephenate dehydrogenase/arogenate dehydrogenase family protein [Candidatus Dormibacteraeota bacterium]|uniref:Prephenate dehydrogenase/arogenate dehydrogenase family protein n=1 Tax=Candidatus Amunia macphersoniae TaxID=3127014 RepID=A0A934KCP8_9BACT|nr:prephenate dehydrogenase/arogenate dehydrogenase family protein [Candidatus Dormibacteraeota bacterium]
MTAPLPATVAVIGFGRFGRLWASMLREDFDVVVYDSAAELREQAAASGFSSDSLRAALSCGVIFYCVPISEFEATLREHLPHFAKLDGPRTLIDVLSVKVHPKEVLDRYLPAAYQAMLTHPMFGPDSVAVSGLAGQTIVVDRYRMAEHAFAAWTEYFASKGLIVVVMTADEHDRLAAESQGVTHFIGRTLERFGFTPTAIDTLGTKKLHEITAQVTNDTEQLFVDLQTRNPHTRAMRVRLSEAQDRVFDQLLPNRLVVDTVIVGIQGGRGSFNEEAARHYMSRTPEAPYELLYLHTTERVLRALHEGSVDRGQFAIHNSAGGMVGESVAAMARYRFAIVEEFAIKISHCLMIGADADLADVDTVMTHPQVLAQCRTSLATKYPTLRQASGDGDLIDHAKVAELLGRGELDASIATMGSRVLADLHGLQVVEDDLQDLDENFTSFLWVQRPPPRA